MTTTRAASFRAARWRKSSYSTAGNDCVEVGQAPGSFTVRDSKNVDRGYLAFSAAAWKIFINSVKYGTYSP